MATITTKVCDRCGKPMEYIGWTAKLKNVFKTGKRIKIRQLYNGNPNGYGYCDSCYELCADCIKELETFLSGDCKNEIYHN